MTFEQFAAIVRDWARRMTPAQVRPAASSIVELPIDLPPKIPSRRRCLWRPGVRAHPRGIAPGGQERAHDSLANLSRRRRSAGGRSQSASLYRRRKREVASCCMNSWRVVQSRKHSSCRDSRARVDRGRGCARRSYTEGQWWLPGPKMGTRRIHTPDWRSKRFEIMEYLQ
jgi:hypothetical protein